jgi:LmbE family N-acetylglucosaminyl deacetylase
VVWRTKRAIAARYSGRVTCLADTAQRVLAFGAHPDDLEVGAGGLIGRLVAAGARVTMVIVSIPNRFEVRLAEARRGAARLGAELVVMSPDDVSRIEDLAMYQLVARFDELVAEHAPDVVITHAACDLHLDHTLVNRATVSACRRAPCDLLAYMASPDLGTQDRPVGTCFADITSTIDVKLAAMAEHASQITPRSIESKRDAARATGRLCGVAYAEAFELMRLRV